MTDNDDLKELEHPPDWAKPIKVRAAVHLPGLAYGDVAYVDQTDDRIREYLGAGMLVREGEE